MPKINPTIKYTSRDYASIRRDLLEYTKRYYPETYRDFSEASFGSLMIDTVSYIGDILSFYLDYQANETFLDTAIEYNNVLRLGRQMGYKYKRAHSSFGEVSCYVIVPALSEGLGPDTSYVPILKASSLFSSNRGSVFSLVDDIDFSRPGNEVIVAAVNQSTGVPTSYAIKAFGRVQSGEIKATSRTVGDYKRYRRVEISDRNITEVISVFDDQGREYFEVDYLSQNVVYKEFRNNNSDNSLVPSIMKPIVVPRRFTTIQERNGMYLQFGFGSESTLTDNPLVDPADVILDVHGRDYIGDTSFDPSKLNETDKLGIAPSKTTLRITYRTNGDSDANSAAGTVTRVVDPKVRFNNRSLLVTEKVNTVVTSLEVENENPINGDVSLPTVDEIKARIQDVYAAQNRAVTREDYKSIAYSMPAKFGAIKRCTIIQDKNSFKRNLNMYVISALRNGQLTPATNTLKANLKLWLNRNRMINDTIDILDARIINIGVDFDIIANLGFNKPLVLQQAISAVRTHFSIKSEIGENITVSDIYNALNKVEGVSDAVNVTIKNFTYSGYSSVFYNIERFTSADERTLYCPENAIFELKRPSKDIKGVVR